MRSFGPLVVVGLAGLAAFKIGGGLFVPLFGMAMGLIAVAMKIAVICAIGYFVITLLKGRRRDREC